MLKMKRRRIWGNAPFRPLRFRACAEVAGVEWARQRPRLPVGGAGALIGGRLLLVVRPVDSARTVLIVAVTHRFHLRVRCERRKSRDRQTQTKPDSVLRQAFWRWEGAYAVLKYHGLNQHDWWASVNWLTIWRTARIVNRRHASSTVQEECSALRLGEANRWAIPQRSGCARRIPPVDSDGRAQAPDLLMGACPSIAQRHMRLGPGDRDGQEQHLSLGLYLLPVRSRTRSGRECDRDRRRSDQRERRR